MVGMVRRSFAALHKKGKAVAEEDSSLTQKQSWRRQAGGPRPSWKALDTQYFFDGQDFDRTRLEAWLQRRCTSRLTNSARWVWMKLDANGFRVTCKFSSSDTIYEEICMEDVLGVLCRHSAKMESEVDQLHECAAYFRRTDLHASEDASDIHSLVLQVEAEYLAQTGHAPQPRGESVALLDTELTIRDFAILTTRMGYYRGVPIIFRASCEEEKDQWVETLRRLMKFPSAQHLAPLSYFAKLRREVYQAYMGPTTQLVVATLICTNFVLNMMQAQFSGAVDEMLEVVDLVFTAIFTVELLVNLFATLVQEFFGDPWNYFDTVVVSVGLVSIVVPDMPGGDILKLMRTFRVFRLFKRIPSLKHLVQSLLKSIPAMANAYVLMTILTSIYAILCVKFFGDISEEARELFADFFTAMFTLWQVMTGDDWSNIVRDMFIPSGNAAGVALFFISFQLLITFTMVNVVVCVLVDEFCGGKDSISNASYNDEPPLLSAVERYQTNNSCRLKPILTDSLTCHDEEAFDEMMHQIWHELCRVAEVADPDAEDTAITFEELVVGMRELPYCPPVIFKWQDWVELVENKDLCTRQGLLSRAGMLEMVQIAINRLATFQLKAAAKAVDDQGWTKEAVNAYLFGMKAKYLCIVGNAMRQDQLTLDRHDKHSPGQRKMLENARFLNMRKLVWEFNRMHKRFTYVEDISKRVRANQDILNAKRPVPQAATLQRLKLASADLLQLSKNPLKNSTSHKSSSSSNVHAASELSAAITQSAYDAPLSPEDFGARLHDVA